MTTLTITPKELEPGDRFEQDGVLHYTVTGVTVTNWRTIANVMYRDGGDGMREWPAPYEDITIERPARIAEPCNRTVQPHDAHGYCPGWSGR